MVLACAGLTPLKAQFLDRQRLIPAEVEAQQLAPDIRAPTEAESTRIAELEQAVRIEQNCTSTWQIELEAPRRELLALYEATWGPDHPATIRPIGALLCHNYYNARSSPEHLQLIERLRVIGERRQLPVAEYAGRDAERYINGQPMPLADAQRKLALARELFGPNSRLAGESSKQLAASLDKFARPGAGYQNMLEWIDIYQRDNTLSPLALAIAFGEMGNYLYGLSRADEALQYHGRAFEIYEGALPGADPNGLYTISAGAISLMGSDIARTNSLLEGVLARQEALPGASDKSHVNTLANLARTAKYQARFSEAAQYLYRIIVAVGPGPDQIWYREMADIALSEPEIAPLAVQIFRALLDEKPDDTMLMEQLGTALMITGKVDEAMPIRERAIALATERFGPNDSETLRLTRNLATHLWMHKSMGTARPYLAQALAGYRAQLAIIPETAAAEQRFGARGWVGILAGELLKLYRLDRSNPADGGEPATLAKAFEVAQLAHPSSSAAAISESAARLIARRNDEGRLFDAWSAAKDRLAAIDAAITLAVQQGGAGDAERSRLIGERPAATTAIETLDRQLRERLPQLTAVLRPDPVTLAELSGSPGMRALLRPDEALILLYPGMPNAGGEMSRGVVFAVTREGSAWADIPLDGTILVDRIEELRLSLADPDNAGRTANADDNNPADFFRFDRAAAHSLYGNLFGDPAIAALVDSKERWVLVPQGPLLSLPFAALVSREPQGGAAGDIDPAALRETAWLGLDKVLTVLPSVDTLRTARRREIDRNGRIEGFFGLGDPAFRGEPDPPVPPRGTIPLAGSGNSAAPTSALAAQQFFRSGAADLDRIAELPRLPNSGPEVQAIAQLVGADRRRVLLQMDATQAGLMARSDEGALRRSELVVFATHALLAGELGGTLAEPALALTPVVSGGNVAPDPANDGLLTASEVATLQFGRALVVLSACNTAGGAAGGEGFSGLVRAFLQAGARSVVATHFPVLDEASELLTTSMVGNMPQTRGDTALAMRSAMRAVAANTDRDALGASFAHPRYWSAYVVVDPD